MARSHIPKPGRSAHPLMERRMTMNRKLIITADDYGLCQSVNDAIEECLTAGAVRATCAMPNMPAFAAAAHIRAKFPQISLGIHWTLTEGRPVLARERIASLVRPDGQFYSPQQLRRRWLRGKIAVDDIRVELDAQYQRFITVAGEPDFWNTHQNFHVWPGLFSLCLTLARELKIPSMRCHRRFTVPRDRSATSHHMRHPVSWLKGKIINRWARSASRQGLLMPDGVIYMPGYTADRASVEEAILRLPWGSINTALELIVHPATTSEEPLFHSLTERRLLEYCMLKDTRLKNRLHLLGIESVNFQALAESN
jgi:chitin disaccharide deacetylase